MKYIVDAATMQAIDSYTINQVMIPSVVLMERAALKVTEVMIDKINKKDRILTVCGTGNNGGDGICAARILSGLGYHVDIYVIGDEKRATDQTKLEIQIARNLGINIFSNVKINEYNVIVDAIFGIGLSKPVTGIFETVINEINNNENVVFSVDIPTGISADTGKVLNAAIKADYTVTFGYNKIGMILYPGRLYTGKITIADIGLPEKALQVSKPKCFTYNKEDLKHLPIRQKDSNKGSFGKVLIIAGCKNMCGACYLSAKAAYRTGAGLVKVLTVEDNRNIIQTALPEAILSTYDPLNLKNKIEVDRILKEIEWATTIVLGPGIGISSASDRLVDIVLSHTNVPVIVDADAINLLSGHKEYVTRESEFVNYNDIELPDNIIVTPHVKEMSRLIDCDIAEIKENIISTALSVTSNKRYILALKDARTVVTNGKDVYVNTSGNNGMATGGSGDVLTGIIAGLIVQGMTKYEATTLGVYIHGLAADYAVKEKSIYSIIASDIIEALPYVFHEMN